ncbi:MAG TPA: membrane protein insertase YidC [Chloroflexota bacterium]|jgi:YidC/Oxa1 family membrane protein insertase|nr:membrane protein insertase YidC [Chloroflexota bacterium]
MDRRTIWAILLMMAIAIAPAIFLKKPPASGAAGQPGSGADSSRGSLRSPADSQSSDTARRSTIGPTAQAPTSPGTAPLPGGPTAAPSADTVRVTSPLYTYGISTRGARLVEATLPRYRSMASTEQGRPAQILPPDSKLLGLTLVLNGRSIPLDDWPFTASSESLQVNGPTPLRLSASREDITVELTYTFHPDDYRIDVDGQVSGIGPNGGFLLVGLGPTLANTEANATENHRALALVTKHSDTERTDFAGLKPGETKTISGPLEWAAVKSKYFVTGVLAFDSAGGRISAVTATAQPTAEKRPDRADIRLSLALPPRGSFSYTTYAGPMEYNRLHRIGHGFDDVNPYGWPGLRTLIRPVAVGVRWLLVWMHEHLHLAYGFVLITFGILVRVLLWPLNQKAMRANMQMQAVQPLMKEIQERYKNDPQKVQQEMFKLYKEHGVNPLGGCWPMLLPMPVLFALFFVFQNSIELRGASFAWLPDLSRPDPLYIIPIIMGLSMFALSKVGQIGMEPNPQMKMMLYVMPVMMTFLFLNFASGLNLYYAVSNISSIPQQWLLARERQKRTARAIVEVKTRPAKNKPAKRNA